MKAIEKPSDTARIPLKKKNAYSFLRWSTKGQSKENRDSRKRQTDSAEKWISEHSNGEYQLSKEVFIADGQSGWTGEHIKMDAQGKAKGELRRFMEQVKDGIISSDSILLIDSYDRFSRLDVPQSLNLFSEFLGSGIGLVFTGSHEKRVISSQLLVKEPHIIYFIVGEMIRANSESVEKSRKIISSQQSKKIKMQGGEVLKHHNAPRYYSYNKDKKAYEQNALTPIVTRIVGEFLGGKSLYQISNSLNADNVRSLRYANKQSNWSRMAIKSLLQSKCLFGEFQKISEYFGEPVIDKDTFDKIQMILARNSENKGNYSTEFINIFRGLARCSTCKRSMSLGVQKTNYKSNKPKAEPYRYFRCSSVANSMPCENRHNMNLADVEQAFFTDFLLKTPIDLINGDEKQEMKKVEKEIVARQTKLNKITEKVNALAQLASVISTAELLKQGQSLKSEQEQLQRDIDNLNTNRTSIMATPVSRDVLGRIIEFDTDKHNGIDIKTIHSPFSMSKVRECLSDNARRLETRNVLPNLISKIMFDTNKSKFKVFNRAGKQVYESSCLKLKQHWKRIIKLSHQPKHIEATKGFSSKQIEEYFERLALKLK